MAGFFLAPNNDSSIKVSNALGAFRNMGLDAEAQYQLGNYTLYLFNKLTAKKPYTVDNEYGFGAAVGAYIYKGLTFDQSINKTIEDCYNDNLSMEEMYGQFTLILYVKKQLFIISDAIYVKHFFSDRSYRFFSSSFFSATAAIGKVSVNDMAVYEKLLTGIIISPDTLVNEVIQMNRQEQEKANEINSNVRFLIHPDFVPLPMHVTGRKQSIIAQASYINKYFEIIKPALNEERIDLGLSAGHDSTLLFAAVAHKYKNNLHLHTHSTGHVHDKEKNAATAMAKAKGFDVTIVPTPRLDESGIDVEKLLYENLVFFDGRTSHDIGGFSATYRGEYRMLATDGCATTLSGVGGECFRNHYSVRGSKLNADSFFEDKIFNRSFVNSAPKSLIERVKKNHIDKAERILKISLHGKVDRINLRRYYSEVLMADGQGHVIDAYSTVSKCIAPFLDIHILAQAYRGIQYLGNCGEYESGIICVLDSSIGSCINANNGFPFNQIPARLRIKEAIRASLSSKTWERLNTIKTRGHGSDKTGYFKSVLQNSVKLEKAFTSLQHRYPNIDFYSVMQGYAMDAAVEYLSLTLEMLVNE